MISTDQIDAAALERAYNWIEVILWAGIALAFARRALLSAGKRRALLAIAAIAFAALSVSDVIEVHTGSWWEPPWLLVLKVACVATMLLVWREWHRRFANRGANRESSPD